jgi:hypothetical protein
MQEANTMQNDCEIELSIRGRDRTLCLPRCSLTNLEPAMARLGWYRQTAAADQRVIEKAEAALQAIEKAGR